MREDKKIIICVYIKLISSKGIWSQDPRPQTALFCVKFRTQTVMSARGDAEKIKKIGHAEATAIEAIGKAEAERMRMKAAAYKQYGDAAKMSLVLESLPKASALKKSGYHASFLKSCKFRI